MRRIDSPLREAGRVFPIRAGGCTGGVAARKPGVIDWWAVGFQ
jgi:hypothetical protein